MALVSATNLDRIRIEVIGESRAITAEGGEWVECYDKAHTAMLREWRMGKIVCRAVGNAVYLEHEGNSGDIAVWAMSSTESAAFVAKQITAVLS